MKKKYNYNFQRLKGKIKEQYNNKDDLAKVLNISDTSLSNKLNNYTRFSYDEIEKLVDILNIKKEEVMDYFFSK